MNDNNNTRVRGEVDIEAQNERRRIQNLVQGIILHLRAGADFVITAIETYGTPKTEDSDGNPITDATIMETESYVDALLSYCGEPLDPKGIPSDAREALNVYNALLEIVADYTDDDGNAEYTEDEYIPAEVMADYGIDRNSLEDAVETFDRVDVQIAKGNNRRILTSVQEIKLRRGKVGKRVSAFPSTSDVQVPENMETVASLREAIKEVEARQTAATSEKVKNPNTYLVQYLSDRREYLDQTATRIEAEVKKAEKAAARNAADTGEATGK